MTTKECLEELIGLLYHENCIDKGVQEALIRTLRKEVKT